MRPTELINVEELPPSEVQRRWEEAYVRFETPEQEIRKFVARLKGLGQAKWPRDASVVDIFCGRGNGLKALELLGFTNLEGVDISGDLLARYEGPAKMYEADCRSLPFEDETKDMVVVQGGLHHLPNLPSDLDQTFAEVRRVLKAGGLFVMVEPWSTPFLTMVHGISDLRLARKFSNTLDAFATMTHYEAGTYFNWLSRPSEVDGLLARHFDATLDDVGWGKKRFVGTRKPV